MIIDLPDAGIILVAVLAFLSGLVTLYLYGKTRSVGVSEKIAPTNVERIDYYEKELIDMKIRLDAMELDGETFTKPDLPTKRVESFDVPEVEEPEFVAPKPKAVARVRNMSFEDSVTFVLEKITQQLILRISLVIHCGSSRKTCR